MEVRIGKVDLDRLVPGNRLQSEFRLPMKLHKGGLILRIDEAKGMDAEPFHEA